MSNRWLTLMLSPPTSSSFTLFVALPIVLAHVDVAGHYGARVVGVVPTVVGPDDIEAPIGRVRIDAVESSRRGDEVIPEVYFDRGFADAGAKEAGTGALGPRPWVVLDVVVVPVRCRAVGRRLRLQCWSSSTRS